MTCREKLKIEHPKNIDLSHYGGCVGCPDHYGYLECPEYCTRDGYPDRCAKCWDREIPENEDNECDKPEMTLNEYQRLALKTEAGMLKNYPRIFNGLMGLNGEAGECIDILKKHLFHGHELDKEHIAKELGDVLWYVAQSADALGYTLEEIAQMNDDKLAARYPNGFEVERSINRKEGDV